MPLSNSIYWGFNLQETPVSNPTHKIFLHDVKEIKAIMQERKVADWNAEWCWITLWQSGPLMWLIFRGWYFSSCWCSYVWISCDNKTIVAKLLNLSIFFHSVASRFYCCASIGKHSCWCIASQLTLLISCHLNVACLWLTTLDYLFLGWLVRSVS